jgi:hypothetical protein
MPQEFIDRCHPSLRSAERNEVQSILKEQSDKGPLGTKDLLTTKKTLKK